MRKGLFALLLSVVTLLGTMASATAKEDSVERLQNAGSVLKEIMGAPDKGIPEEVLDDAKCIVVVPHLIKAGFIIGGKHGRGVASCRTSTGWSAPAFISVGGGSWGLQIGAEGVDLVMLVMNDKGLQHLLSSKFQISGEGSAAAGPVGRHASAGTDWKLNSELLDLLSIQRGLCRADPRGRGDRAGLRLHRSHLRQRHTLPPGADRQCHTAGCGGAFHVSGRNGRPQGCGEGSPGPGGGQEIGFGSYRSSVVKRQNLAGPEFFWFNPATECLAPPCAVGLFYGESVVERMTVLQYCV